MGFPVVGDVVPCPTRRALNGIPVYFSSSHSLYSRDGVTFVKSPCIGLQQVSFELGIANQFSGIFLEIGMGGCVMN
jgi:hypothetical protein